MGPVVGHKIESEKLYSEHELVFRLHWSDEALSRARLREGLAFVTIGKDRFYEGVDLLAWLKRRKRSIPIPASAVVPGMFPAATVGR